MAAPNEIITRRGLVLLALLAAEGSLASAPAAARAGKQRLVLSSGFLCFSNHVGVLRALEAAGELDRGRLGAVVGTSSGAIVGSMLAAGMSVDDISALVSARRPLALCRPALAPWRGLFSAERLGHVLAEVLPGCFEDLPVPFAVGVARREAPGGPEPVLLSRGPLVPAVLASCAVPLIFQPVYVGGAMYVDGGIVDRTCVDLSSGFWREAAGAEMGSTLVHLVSDRAGVAFGPRDGIRDATRLEIVRTSRTRQSLARPFGPSYHAEVEAAAAACAAVLAARGGRSAGAGA